MYCNNPLICWDVPYPCEGIVYFQTVHPVRQTPDSCWLVLVHISRIDRLKSTTDQSSWARFGLASSQDTQFPFAVPAYKHTKKVMHFCLVIYLQINQNQRKNTLQVLMVSKQMQKKKKSKSPFCLKCFFPQMFLFFGQKLW